MYMYLCWLCSIELKIKKKTTIITHLTVLLLLFLISTPCLIPWDESHLVVVKMFTSSPVDNGVIWVNLDLRCIENVLTDFDS